MSELQERVDFEWIKEKAAEFNCSIADLIVLARQNDPFYTGTAGDIAQAQWFADIWNRGGFGQGAHLRRLHYWCVSQSGLMQSNGKAYENTDECWKYLCQTSKAARYLGLVQISDIADHKNPEPHIYASYRNNRRPTFTVETPSLSDPYIGIDGFCESDYQPYHLEVFVEKSTMNDVLDPICQEYFANLVTGEGEMSLKGVDDLALRILHADRPARIFYISDFDPAGQSMPQAVARKLEYLIQGRGLDVKLRPIVLTREQIAKYALPKTPIKESEKRATVFEERFGRGAVELDALEALHPGVLAAIVRAAIEPYFSHESLTEVRRKERALRQAIQAEVKAVTSKYSVEIEALDRMSAELENIKINLAKYRPLPGATNADDAQHSWLLDSQRSYLEQIRAYRQAKRGGAA